MARGEKLVKLLYQQHGAALLAYAERLTEGRRGWAEEIVTETLVRAAETPTTVGRGMPTRLWLFGIAHDVVGEAVSQRDLSVNRRGLTVADALFSLPRRHRDVLLQPRQDTGRKAAFAALQALKSALADRGVTKSAEDPGVGVDDLLAKRQQ